jgi:ATP-GRASP peptide maturase of grasp-with-spasm system
MILIISENNDYFTDKVIEWLLYFGISDLVRINESDKIFVKEIDLRQDGNFCFSLNGKDIWASDVDFFWYRRGNLNPLVDKKFDFKDNKMNEDIDKFLFHEWKVCKNFILHLLHKKPSLGNFFLSEVNKLVNLEIAKECGLDVPITYIASNPKRLQSFHNIYPSITKPIGEVMPIMYDKGYFMMYSSEFEEKYFSEKQTIVPSLLQEKIHKHFEIRVFVMFDRLYSMAIFSQRNEKTNIDYRNYDDEKPNRMIPYKLPLSIEQKILFFMNKINLNTGSLDLIRTFDGRFIFLEINPAGNIEMIDVNCNYNIDKEIASLIKDSIENAKQ